MSERLCHDPAATSSLYNEIRRSDVGPHNRLELNRGE